MDDSLITEIKANRIYFVGWLWDNVFGITGGIIFYPDICEFKEYALDTLIRILIRAIREGKFAKDVTLSSIVANFGSTMTSHDENVERAYSMLAGNTPVEEEKLFATYLGLTLKTTDMFLLPLRLTFGGTETVFSVQTAFNKMGGGLCYSFFTQNWSHLKQNNHIILLLGYRTNTAYMQREFMVYNFTGDRKITWVDATSFAKKIENCNRIVKTNKAREWHSSDPILLCFKDVENFGSGGNDAAIRSVEHLRDEKARKLRLTDFSLELQREFCLLEPCAGTANKDLFTKSGSAMSDPYGSHVTWQLMRGLFTGREYMLSAKEIPIGGKYVCMKTPKNIVYISINDFQLNFEVVGVMYLNDVPVLMLLYPYEFVRDYFSEDGVDMDIGHALPMAQFVRKHKDLIKVTGVKKRSTPSIFANEAGRLVLCEVSPKGLFDDMYSMPFEELATSANNDSYIKAVKDNWQSQINRVFVPEFRLSSITSSSGMKADTEFGVDYFAKFSLKQR